MNTLRLARPVCAPSRGAAGAGAAQPRDATTPMAGRAPVLPSRAVLSRQMLLPFGALAPIQRLRTG